MEKMEAIRIDKSDGVRIALEDIEAIADLVFRKVLESDDFAECAENYCREHGWREPE